MPIHEKSLIRPENLVTHDKLELDGIDVSIAVMDFDFIGGSMGSVVGEKIARSLLDALNSVAECYGLPVIVSTHPRTRKRLEVLQSANDEHRQDLLALLEPIDVQSLQAGYESHLALRTRLPADQGLNTYYSNVHRDWVWGEEENRASMAQLARVLDESGGRGTGDCLVLGAGAGRLAYDVHQGDGAERTVGVDFNPLLFLIARRMYTGASLELYEFPLAPASLEDVAVRQTLRAPWPPKDGLHLVLADVLRAPFAKRTFDTVVTPWLIDIVSEDLRIFARRINRLLKPGGRWITFGSLAFDHASRARRYSPDEVLEIAGVGELVEVHDLVAGFPNHVSDDRGPDEAGAASDQAFHGAPFRTRSGRK